jgi:hypothetical protein
MKRVIGVTLAAALVFLGALYVTLWATEADVCGLPNLDCLSRSCTPAVPDRYEIVGSNPLQPGVFRFVILDTIEGNIITQDVRVVDSGIGPLSVPLFD